MRISKLLAAATGIEFVLFGAVVAVIGLAAGLPLDIWITGHLDLVNQGAPIWVLMLFAGAALTYLGLERRRARTVVLIIAAVALAAYAPPVLGEYAARMRIALFAPNARSGDLKVLQFNVLEVNFKPSYAREQILAADADIVTLQEPHPEVQADPEVRALYPYRVLSTRPECQVGCAMMILSKRPITASAAPILPGGSQRPHQPGEDGDVQVLWADTSGPDGKPVRVLTTHLGWPIPVIPRDQQRRAFDRYMRTLDRTSLIVTGDFNSSPWSVDMRRQDRSLRPLSRRTRALYTWMAYIPRLWRPSHLTFLALDHVYAGPSWKTVGLRRMGRGGSDHYPVLVTLRRAAG